MFKECDARLGGAAIMVSGGNPVIKNCVFENCGQMFLTSVIMVNSNIYMERCLLYGQAFALEFYNEATIKNLTIANSTIVTGEMVQYT